MGTVTKITRAQFTIGDLVRHRLFDYRGVVVDGDPNFPPSEAWYGIVAKSAPPERQTWMLGLVPTVGSSTYVAERNLEQDQSASPIHHPMLDEFFSKLENGRYVNDRRIN